MQPQIRDVCDESFMRTFSSSSTKPPTPPPLPHGHTHSHDHVHVLLLDVTLARLGSGGWGVWGVATGTQTLPKKRRNERKKKEGREEEGVTRSHLGGGGGIKIYPRVTMAAMIAA